MNDDEQYQVVQDLLIKNGYNLVTCGQCGSVQIIKLSDEELKCTDCGFCSEHCDFPDLFY